MSSQTDTPIRLIGLKDTLNVLKSYFFEMLRKFYWFIIVLAVVLFTTRWQLKRKPVSYTANASLMVNNDSSPMTGLMQLAGQFGLSSGGEGVPTEKIIDLLASKQLVYATLLKKVEIGGKRDMLFNHYIDVFDMPSLWQTDTLLNGFRFTEKPIKDFNIKENKAAQQIYETVTQLYMSAMVGKSGIVRASCTSTSETFCKEFMSALAHTLSDYYTDKSVEQQERTYRLIRQRCDSLERALYSTEYALANWIDANRTALRAGSLPARTGIKRDQYEREAEVLNVMYIEAVKNRELAQLNLLMNTPIIQLIDLPSYPLPIKQTNRLLSYIFAAAAAIGITALLIVLNKIIKDELGTYTK